jgi:hypothetical protein
VEQRTGKRRGTIEPTSGGLIAYIKVWRIFYAAYRHLLHTFEQIITLMPYAFKALLNNYQNTVI